MFDKLVVSTAQRRRGKNGKVSFFGTVVIYLSTVAIAFALSIVLATPKLAGHPLSDFPSQHRPRPTPSVVVDFVVDHGNSGGVPPRQDLNNLRRLEAIIGHTQTNHRELPFRRERTSVQATAVAGGDPNAPAN